MFQGLKDCHGWTTHLVQIQNHNRNWTVMNEQTLRLTFKWCGRCSVKPQEVVVALDMGDNLIQGLYKMIAPPAGI